ncbi:MAG TPA: hypothetical protein VE397_06210, partial [Stellaceae bacterium]|nr:hypothetical protein [Stellaceae bacterium]
ASLRGGGGVELCQRAESLGIATLLISGEPQKGYQSPFLQKPFRLAELEGELRRLVPGFP